jgi:hypothetical protein
MGSGVESRHASRNIGSSLPSKRWQRQVQGYSAQDQAPTSRHGREIRKGHRPMSELIAGVASRLPFTVVWN